MDGSSSLSAAATATHNRPSCAACKFQHRRCMPDCILAPFFPASEQQKFLKAHCLFGVKNMQKQLQALDPEHNAEAMKTMIYEAEVRHIDPVGGCRRIILDLESKLQRTTPCRTRLHEHETDRTSRASASHAGGEYAPCHRCSATSGAELDMFGYHSIGHRR
ncbi:hypothetical protein Cni_G20468 [Canna indica]|uniref:LOB domain-containing protein n=1 Tax=Canna indica TaxID=4628 RepID=A0AAQ3KP07_9LILI|nr:hypothetical protein Cni_G20468 [Canna indica]